MLFLKNDNVRGNTFINQTTTLTNMKHNLKITLILVLLFLTAQIIGLFVLTKYVDVNKTAETGATVYKELPYSMERPPTQGTSTTIYVIIAVAIGTILALLLIKYRQKNLWKIWFFLASWMCLSLAFAALMNTVVAAILALILALWKILRTNVYVHNITELFIYSGIAAVFVPVMNIWAAVILLVIIAVYDWIAVWKTKHMVTLATSNDVISVFPGLAISYKSDSKNKGSKKISQKTVTSKTTTAPKPGANTAVLGGGDIAFPLLFAGTAMKTLGFSGAVIISIVATISLFILLMKAEKGKFYPAMPFLSAGCFIGFGIAYLASLMH